MVRTIKQAAAALGAATFALCASILGRAQAAPSCPLDLGALEDAKPNKLYVYYPEADDPTYPSFGGVLTPTSPAREFNISDLASFTGTIEDLIAASTDVVTDDFCEFNVKVIGTTTPPPTTAPRRVTVAVGSDAVFEGTASATCPATSVSNPACVAPFNRTPPCFLYGRTRQGTPGFSRVWAGTYQAMMGGPGGELEGPRSTLDRWAFAIGGTAAHEAGHAYGLSHANGETVRPGEGPIGTHIMPSGCALTNEDRVGGRRHFDDTSFSILAANVGLSLATLHGWDFTNPNEAPASSLVMTCLSKETSLAPASSYLGDLSPWDTPVVTAAGTTTFQGAEYNRFFITWSVPKAWSRGRPGEVDPGESFHLGTTFAGVDLAEPNPVIITAISLRGNLRAPLPLQPRMVGYDAGSLDVSGAFDVRFFNAEPARPLILSEVTVSELPRVAAIEAMRAGAPLRSWDGVGVVPWKTERKRMRSAGGGGGDPREEVWIKDAQSVPIARLSQGRHVFLDIKPQDCGGAASSPLEDGNLDDAPCTPGQRVDLFPSTMVLVAATVIDPEAKHWDPARGKFVVGPVRSRLFYQVRGVHPDLNRNGVDDALDIYNGASRDDNHDGVPDEAQRGERATSPR